MTPWDRPRFTIAVVLLALLTAAVRGEDAPAKSEASPAKAEPVHSEKAAPAPAHTSKACPAKFGPGDHTRSLMQDKLKRTYLVHVPPGYDPAKATPVVLALHGAGMNGPMMAWVCGMNAKADAAGFIVVYPSGTGAGPFMTWNSGGFKGKLSEGKPDDVAFIGRLLDDLATAVTVDDKRVYACGLSNGGMMCYRLAAELSHRIAAIAPVAGTVAIDGSNPQRPVSVLHFHGLKDKIVPFVKDPEMLPSFIDFKGGEDSIQTWVKLNGCQESPRADILSKEGDAMTVTRQTYSGGRDESEVVLITIDNAGHTWPGQKPPVGLIGKSAMNISANDLMWEFFQKHPLK